MSEHNKNNNAPAKGSPASTSAIGADGKHNTGTNKQEAPRKPDHEHGREHTPSVVSTKKGTDTDHTSTHERTRTSDGEHVQQPNMERNNEAGDVKRTVAEGTEIRNEGKAPAEPMTSGMTTYKK